MTRSSYRYNQGVGDYGAIWVAKHRRYFDGGTFGGKRLCDGIFGDDGSSYGDYGAIWVTR